MLLGVQGDAWTQEKGAIAFPEAKTFPTTVGILGGTSTGILSVLVALEG